MYRYLQAEFHSFQNDGRDLRCFQLQSCKKRYGERACITKGSENKRAQLQPVVAFDQSTLAFTVILNPDALLFVQQTQQVRANMLNW